MATTRELFDRIKPEGIPAAVESVIWELILKTCVGCDAGEGIVRTTKKARKQMKSYGQKPQNYAHPEVYPGEPTYYAECDSIWFWEILADWPVESDDWPEGKLDEILRGD